MESGARVILVVGAEFKGTPQEERTFNQWYCDVHAPYVLELGAAGANRYELLTTMPDYPMGAPPYMAIYEFANRDAFQAWIRDGLPAALAQRRDLWSDKQYVPKWLGAYERVNVFQSP